MPSINLYNKDCLDILKMMESHSVDSIVTDPPYGLGIVKDIAGLLKAWMSGDNGDDFVGGNGFLGKEWDKMVPPPSVWRECLRVLKPGGHMLVFAGTRTQDLMGISIRLAGAELRDEISYIGTLGWHYGSGFPKGTNISKDIDAVKSREKNLNEFASYVGKVRGAAGLTLKQVDDRVGTRTATGWWEGRRKEIKLPQYDKYLRLKEALGMDDRFDFLYSGYEGDTVDTRAGKGVNTVVMSSDRNAPVYTPDSEEAKKWDKWNTALKPSHEPILMFRKSLSERTISQNVLKHGVGGLNVGECQNIEGNEARWPSNVALCNGDDSKFFNRFNEDLYMYCDKSGISDRHRGIDNCGNTHPTVKPITLCEWLVKMVTPHGGIVLDPFMGSGSIGIAAIINDFKYIGIEKEPEYFDIAKKRIEFEEKEHGDSCTKNKRS